MTLCRVSWVLPGANAEAAGLGWSTVIAVIWCSFCGGKRLHLIVIQQHLGWKGSAQGLCMLLTMPDKNPGGRPRSEDPRSVIKPVRFTDGEWTAVEQAASEIGLSPSAFIRAAAVAHADRISQARSRTE